MIVNDLINHTSRLQGNYVRGNSIYISVSNMDYLANQISEIDTKHGMLITPYLIAESGILYELHYYEFDIEVMGEKSYFTEFNRNNILATEITEKLKPQAIVAVGDRDFYSKVVNEYLSKMKTMKFLEVKEYHPQLKRAKLFYQVFY